MSKQDTKTPPVDAKIAKRLFEMRTVLVHGEVTSQMARDVTGQLLALSGESD
ncbi:MAG: ATP-dependent Clp protease proteolytic subunit, partial [Deltaproteobacteria bacterium]|nr:ATP-dependent Clp protease proteolytic subunit [Deltaproteobacteria bacterium]